jgi:hypothetical protein
MIRKWAGDIGQWESSGEWLETQHRTATWLSFLFSLFIKDIKVGKIQFSCDREPKKKHQ